MTNLEIQVMKRWVKNFPEVRNFAPLTENEMACALESVEVGFVLQNESKTYLTLKLNIDKNCPKYDKC